MKNVLALLLPASLAAITIGEASLHQYDDGPAPAPSFQFGPGDPGWFSFRLGGYKKTGDEVPRVHMTWRVEVKDSAGVPVVESKADDINVTLAGEDKNWQPKKRHDFQLPPMLDSGEYTVTVSAKDELANQAARQDLKFNVRSSLRVEASPALVARNFRFLRGEEDAVPLQPASYKQGSALWARFEITGYKFGPRNALDVAYGLEVLRADGSRLYAEPNAAGDKDSTFYPKRYVPGSLSLNLQNDIPKGNYTIVLRLADKLGKQTAESRHEFTVE